MHSPSPSFIASPCGRILQLSNIDTPPVPLPRRRPGGAHPPHPARRPHPRRLLTAPAPRTRLRVRVGRHLAHGLGTQHPAPSPAPSLSPPCDTPPPRRPPPASPTPTKTVRPRPGRPDPCSTRSPASGPVPEAGLFRFWSQSRQLRAVRHSMDHEPGNGLPKWGAMLASQSWQGFWVCQDAPAAHGAAHA